MTEQTAKFIALDLASDREVRLFAHSEGAAISYSSINSIRSDLQSLGVPESKLQNLTIITMGGFSPPSKGWSSGAKVINVENNYDLVPILARNSKNKSDVLISSLTVHPLANYYE